MGDGARVAFSLPTAEASPDFRWYPKQGSVKGYVAGVLATVAMAFKRFEHETAYERANNFIGRVVEVHPDLLDLHARDPEGFTGFLRNLLLFETDTQLYLLDAQGTVLAASGRAQPKPGFKVRLDPVMEAVASAGDRRRAAYVMGDDPEHMNVDAVIAARPLRRSVIIPSSIALRRSSRPDAPTRISSRSSSLISITSYRPTRPL